MNGRPGNTLELCLLDSGSTATLLNQRMLPPEVTPKVGTAQAFTTTQGTYSVQDFVTSEEIFFLTFAKHVFYRKYKWGSSTVIEHDMTSS